MDDLESVLTVTAYNTSDANITFGHDTEFTASNGTYILYLPLHLE